MGPACLVYVAGPLLLIAFTGPAIIYKQYLDADAGLLAAYFCQQQTTWMKKMPIMNAILQTVADASFTDADGNKSGIGHGYILFLGSAAAGMEALSAKALDKILGLRLWNGWKNDILEEGHSILLVVDSEEGADLHLNSIKDHHFFKEGKVVVFVRGPARSIEYTNLGPCTIPLSFNK